jgi:predicted anti-sigma-YlaC factor YlaD
MIAVDTLGDMLASGDSVFTEDDDIELIGEALPFSLKLAESLLTEDPDHRGLLLAAARGYVLYAYAYVQFPAEQAATEDIEHARRLRSRARKLYLRAFDYAMRGLEVNHPGIGQTLLRAPERALARIDGDAVGEVPYLYWSASALGLAISVSKNDPAMLARLPEVQALLQRSLALDEAYDHGALHEFALVWADVAPGAPEPGAIDRHYRRALELSDGRRASLYVAYAMATALPSQERQQFRSLMEKALAVDTDALPGIRLLNMVAQRRARWLLSRTGELFLE